MLKILLCDAVEVRRIDLTPEVNIQQDAENKAHAGSKHFHFSAIANSVVWINTKATYLFSMPQESIG